MLPQYLLESLHHIFWHSLLTKEFSNCLFISSRINNVFAILVLPDSKVVWQFVHLQEFFVDSCRCSVSIDAQQRTLVQSSLVIIGINSVHFFFFLEHAGDLHVNILRRKKGETPRYTVFWREKPEKNPPHTRLHCTLKHTQDLT